MALGVHRPAEVIVALSDRSIHCYNIGIPLIKRTSVLTSPDDLKLVAKLSAGSHHKNTIHHISVHPLAPKVLTTSPSESILWDMETWTKLLVLSGGKNQGGVFQVTPPSPPLLLILCCGLCACSDRHLFLKWVN